MSKKIFYSRWILESEMTNYSKRSSEDNALKELNSALWAKDAARVEDICRNGRITHQLMDKGEDGRKGVFNLWTPLTYAISVVECSLSILDLLIQYGAGMETEDGWGYTPLGAAAYSNRENVFKHLFHNKGADPNSKCRKL